MTGNIRLTLAFNPFSAVGAEAVHADLPHAISFSLSGGMGFTAHHFTAAGTGELDAFGLHGTGNAVISRTPPEPAPADRSAPTSLSPALARRSRSRVPGTQIAHFDLDVIGGDPSKLVTVPGTASSAKAGHPVHIAVVAGRSLLSLSATAPGGPPGLMFARPGRPDLPFKQPRRAHHRRSKPARNSTSTTVAVLRRGPDMTVSAMNGTARR